MRSGEKIAKFIYSAGGAVVFVFTAVISVWLFYLSSSVTAIMAYEDEHVFFIKDVGPGMVIGILILLFLFSGIYKKRRKYWDNTARCERILKNICFLLTIAFAAIGCIIVKTTHLLPVYDQYKVFLVAKDFLEGNYIEWQTGQYMDMFPFQNGMVLLMIPFAMMGDDGVFIFQYVNVFVLIIVNMGLAKVVKEYFGRSMGYATYIAATLCLPMWGQITFVYGFLWQIAFGIWGIYKMIRFQKTGKRSDAAAGIIFLALGPVFKYNGVLIVIAASLMLFVRMLHRKEGRLRNLTALILLVLCTYATLGGIRAYFDHTTGARPDAGIGMKGYVALGISESSVAPGWFNDINTSVYKENAEDLSRVEERYEEIIEERLGVFAADHEYGVRFFARKIASMWTEPAMQCFTNTSIRNLYGTLSYTWKDILYNGGVVNTILYIVMDIAQACLYFGMMLRLFWIWKNKKIRNCLEEGDLFVLFLGGFIYHLIFEAKCHYVLPYFIVMIPYALKGYSDTISEIAKYGVKKSRSLRFTVLALIIGVVIYIVPSRFLDNTLRLGTATGDYMWYLQNDLEWKDPDYKKWG
ncbi:MAG: hypothetical protein J6X94_08075 [Lachnospiraceae bacterium]|nr:hypothetical protein [Lachnospiraceae bacterium]